MSVRKGTVEISDGETVSRQDFIGDGRPDPSVAQYNQILIGIQFIHSSNQFVKGDVQDILPVQAVLAPYIQVRSGRSLPQKGKLLDSQGPWRQRSDRIKGSPGITLDDREIPGFPPLKSTVQDVDAP